jgi:hypothetical protein
MGRLATILLSVVGAGVLLGCVIPDDPPAPKPSSSNRFVHASKPSKPDLQFRIRVEADRPGLRIYDGQGEFLGTTPLVLQCGFAWYRDPQTGGVGMETYGVRLFTITTPSGHWEAFLSGYLVDDNAVFRLAERLGEGRVGQSLRDTTVHLPLTDVKPILSLTKPGFGLSGKRIAVLPFAGSDALSKQVESLFLIGVLYAQEGEEVSSIPVSVWKDMVQNKNTNEPSRPRIVARSELRKVLDELDLQLADLTDKKAAVKVGKILGVQYLVMGQAAVTARTITYAVVEP